jgi:hypothetical protein
VSFSYVRKRRGLLPSLPLHRPLFGCILRAENNEKVRVFGSVAGVTAVDRDEAAGLSTLRCLSRGREYAPRNDSEYTLISSTKLVL